MANDKKLLLMIQSMEVDDCILMPVDRGEHEGYVRYCQNQKHQPGGKIFRTTTYLDKLFIIRVA